MNFTTGRVFSGLCLAALLAAVLGLTALIYWPGLEGPFLLDDGGSVGILSSTTFSWQSLYYDVTHNLSGLLGRPVSVFSLAFTNIVHGPAPWGFKYHNLLLHLLNGLLLFWLLLKLLPRLSPTLTNRRVVVIAGTTAAVWLLHPLLVSTVLYAVQRMAQLSALFTLAALLAYAHIRDAAIAGSLRFHAQAWLLFPLLLLLAVLSKESGALIPVYLVLIELVVYRLRWSSVEERKRLLWFHAMFVLLPVVVGAVYLLTHLEAFTSYSTRDYTLPERVMTQFQVMLHYVKWILLPVVSEMSLFHDGWPVVRQFNVLTAFLGLLWAGMALAVVLLRERAPVIAFGIGWFLVSHLMESTIFGLEMVFEHRNYLAAAGLLLIPVFYLMTLPGGRKGVILPLLVLPLFAFMTHARVSEWRSEEMIYSMAVRDHPESIRAQIAYAGIEYSKGNLDVALRHMGIASELNPTQYSSTMIRIMMLCGRNREAEIDELLMEATSRAALYPATPGSIGTVDMITAEFRRGKCVEVRPERIVSLLQVARQQPSNAINKEFTGFLQRQEGLLHYLMGNKGKGYELLTQAYENSGHPRMLGELINVEIQLGALDTAEHLLTLLEEDNRKRLGSETYLLERARTELLAARRRQEQKNAAAPAAQ